MHDHTTYHIGGGKKETPGCTRRRWSPTPDGLPPINKKNEHIMSFFRNLFRVAPVDAPIAAPTPVIIPAPVTNSIIEQYKELEDIRKQYKERENARTLKRSPYQFFTIEEEAPSNNIRINKLQEPLGYWKATASADTEKYILQPLTAHGKTKEDALKNIKEIIVFAHQSMHYPNIKDVNNYTRVNVQIQTDKNFDSFGMTRNIVDAIMNIPGIESDIIAAPIDGIRQITWTTTNLRKFETALYAYRDAKNVQETQHVTSMRAFIAKLEQMGRGTVTCTIV